MTLGEDYTATPEKSAGVSKANEQLKKGDHEKAMETLKLANVDVSFVTEVAPLEKTTSGIDQAVHLLNEGKYYEANQALKSVEDGFRFDVTDIDSAPKSASNKVAPPASASASVKKERDDCTRGVSLLSS
jgi:soluble cytochrome b562